MQTLLCVLIFEPARDTKTGEETEAVGMTVVPVLITEIDRNTLVFTDF